MNIISVSYFLLKIAAVGSGVSLSALCYPNGSAGYTWFRTDDLVDRIQIEYQCYTNDTEVRRNMSQYFQKSGIRTAASSRIAKETITVHLE